MKREDFPRTLERRDSAGESGTRNSPASASSVLPTQFRRDQQRSRWFVYEKGARNRRGTGAQQQTAAGDARVWPYC